MKITQKETFEKDVIVEVFCNKCGGSCNRYEGPGWVGLVETTVVGDGPPLGNGTKYTFSMCEDCLHKLFETFKIQVDSQEPFWR